jgi:hypothetical protein
MPDTERPKSATSLRHGRHESRTTGQVTSEKSNSEEDRRKEEIAQKKNYMTNISWRYGRTVQLRWCLPHVYQLLLSLLFHEVGRILEQKLVLHHLMGMSALIKHQITRPYGFFCTLHATKLDTCSFHFLYTTNTNRQLHIYSAFLDKLIFALRVP